MRRGIGPLFERLAREWIGATRFLSSVSQITAHPSYKEIISLGRPAIPLILRELEKETAFAWFNALHSITGENPVPEKYAGCFHIMKGFWLHWAVCNGIKWRKQ